MKLVAWFVKNKVSANILMLFLIIGGMISVKGMKTSVFPVIDPRLINISTKYPGAAPSEVEFGISKKIEESIIGISGIKKVSSSSHEGYSNISLEVEDFIDMNQILNDVKSKVDSITNFLPLNSEKPIISRSDTSQSLIKLVIFGKNLTDHQLRHWAETVRDQILLINSISLVNITGTKNYQISIEVNENNLRRYNLSLKEIASLIENSTKDLSGGSITTDRNEILLRVKERKYSGKDLENIPIKFNIEDGSIIYLKNIANIRDEFENRESETTYQNQKAIFLNILRSESQDTFLLTKKINNYLKLISLPEGVEVKIYQDDSVFLKGRMFLLLKNAVIGFGLVFICLILFLDLKLAFWTSLGIPISFLGGLLIISFFGVTINMISLFALIIVLGIVVDDSVVVGESIFAEQKKGNNVISGVSKVISPVTIGVLTTMLMFFPLILSSGILGQIMKPIPLVVIAVLLVSLIEVFFILPSHLSNPSYLSNGNLAKVRNYINLRLRIFIDKFFLKFLRKVLKFRYCTIVFLFCFLFLILNLLQTGAIKFIFFPKIDSNEIIATITMKPGTSFAVTKRNTLEILSAFDNARKEINEIENRDIVKNIVVSIGNIENSTNTPFTQNSESNISYKSQIVIHLVSGSKRKLLAHEIENIWKTYITSFHNMESLVIESNLVRNGSDFEIEISHRDNKELDKAKEYLKDKLSNFDGVSEVRDNIHQGKKEFIFKITDNAILENFTINDIAKQLRNSFYGSEVDRIQIGNNEIKILVSYPYKMRNTLSYLDQIRIENNGTKISLKDSVDVKINHSYSVIKRVNGKRIVNISADIDNDITTPDILLNKIKKDIWPEMVKIFPSISYNLSGQSEDQREDLKTLKKNMIIGLMAVFMLLASQLRSYIYPLIIISIIPFGIAGSILGHLALGYNLSFISLFGIIALSGIVINNSIVLIDYYNNLNKIYPNEDMTKLLIRTISKRFRPILLTSLTTILGLLPMILETSLQARFLIPMAISISFGILVAGFIVMIIVPVLILIIEDTKIFLHTRIKKIFCN